MSRKVGADQAETIASPFCPILDLNTSTLHYHEYTITALLSEPEYEDQLTDVGIFKPVSFDDLRLLRTEKDSAVCQKINERTELSSRYRYDRELDRYVPEAYVAYYELRDRYIVFQQPYTPGSSLDGVIGPSASGWVFVRVYDKKNLNFMGGLPSKCFLLSGMTGRRYQHMHLIEKIRLGSFEPGSEM